jgi:hypothetical protein
VKRRLVVHLKATAVWLLVSLICGMRALAQTDIPKYEVGVHLAVLRLHTYHGTEVGVGGRFTYNLRNFIAVESEFSVFPRELTRIPEPCPPDQSVCVAAPSFPTFSDRRIEGLFGVKAAGYRSDRLGLFAKVRPGFIHFRSVMWVVCINPPCNPPRDSRTEAAFDLGAVVEVYPSRGVAIRFDLGDTYIRGNGGKFFLQTDRLGHNLQLNGGIGFRF